LANKLHPNPYKLGWVQDGVEVCVYYWCLFTCNLGFYVDEVWSDVFSMTAYHRLLGRLWWYGRSIVHNGRAHMYSFEKDGKQHSLITTKEGNNKNVMLLANTSSMLVRETKECYLDFAKNLDEDKTIFLMNDIPKEFWDLSGRIQRSLADGQRFTSPKKGFSSN
jgi:hypothetical protein